MIKKGEIKYNLKISYDLSIIALALKVIIFQNTIFYKIKLLGCVAQR